MILRHFRAKGLHGFLKFEFDFKPDLTFLTGINGAGKTTVVNAVAGLISPSLSTLAAMRHEEMALTISNEGRDLVIASVNNGDELTLRVTGAKEQLVVAIPPSEAQARTSRGPEDPADYFNEVEARNAKHPVLTIIRSLPTPLLLGIDRRLGRVREQDERYSFALHSRRLRNIFSTSLHLGLVEASSVAEKVFAEVQAKQRALADQLRRDIILAAIRYLPTEAPTDPTPVSVSKAAAIRSTLRELGISETHIDERLTPFVDKLNDILKYAPFPSSFEDALKIKDSARREAYMEWTINRQHFDRLLEVVNKVDHYTTRHRAAGQPIDQYLTLVNDFLMDSGKELQFDRTGSLVVTHPLAGTRPITGLSSGESQIVVILTHLAFNPAAKGATVFIVDEPELSLHLRWQELLVPAITTVNPSLQLVLATHSPSIILDRIDKCVDIVQRA